LYWQLGHSNEVPAAPAWVAGPTFGNYFNVRRAHQHDRRKNLLNKR
jgi:hypothetical protein